MSETVTQPGNIQGQLLELFLYLGSQWILYLLLILSVLSVALAIERVVYFNRHTDDLDALRERLASLLDKGDIPQARQMLAKSPSQAAAITLVGLDNLDRGAAAVEETLAGVAQMTRLEMDRGLVFLGTLGNNAPFIGLFGTVLGIIRSFRDLALNTLGGSSAVMSGIAEALVATAVGLLVALPAVAVFNAFQRLIRRRLVAANAMSRLVLAHIKRVPPAGSA